MQNEQELQLELKKLEQELLDLKTIQGAVKSADGFAYTYTNSGSGLQYQTLRVHFKSGSGPILCYCSSKYGVPLKITGNHQDFSFRFLWQGGTSFFSNVPIESVENIT